MPSDGTLIMTEWTCPGTLLWGLARSVLATDVALVHSCEEHRPLMWVLSTHVRIVVH